MKFQETVAARNEGGMNTITTTALAFTNAIGRENGRRKTGCVETGDHFKTIGVARGKTNVSCGSRTMRSFISDFESGDLARRTEVFNMPKNGEVRGSIGLGTAIHMSANVTIGRDLMDMKMLIEFGTSGLLCTKHGIESM
jgi:hypothetical protein